MSKKIIVITGASSGFGRLTADALAKAGHTVYASMRDTTGRNALQVADVKKFAQENNVDLRPIELVRTAPDYQNLLDSRFATHPIVPPSLIRSKLQTKKNRHPPKDQQDGGRCILNHAGKPKMEIPV